MRKKMTWTTWYVVEIITEASILTCSSYKTDDIKKRGFNWLVPIGRSFTQHEEKNDVCLHVSSRTISDYSITIRLMSRVMIIRLPRIRSRE